MTSERYVRQRPLLGEEGQRKLAQASVFIAGAGGLGSPVATYLAAAGVGHITLLDCDTVDETNLNRQFLHSSKDIGQKKAQSGADKLRALNPEIEITVKTEKLTADNVSDLAGGCQIIADALDNNETRRILARFAQETGRPIFHGAVSGWYGQFAAFVPDKEASGACYFCAFLEESEQKNEQEAPFPIVGTTAGIVGSMQANAIVKHIIGIEIETGCLFIWDGMKQSLDKIEILKDENCPICSK